MKLTVRGSSMRGILEDGDEIELDELGNTLGLGDLVVFRSATGLLVKKVFGVPNTSISVNGLLLNIGGQTIALQNEAQSLCWLDWSKDGKVPESYLVVFGTRSDSVDSKQLGFIPFNDIVGKVIKDK